MSTEKLFGFEFVRKDKEDKNTPSFSPAQSDDGSLVVGGGGVYGTSVDLDGSVRSEADLIDKYREAAQTPELDTAISKIVNEAIVQDEDNQVVKIVLDNIQYSDSIKTKISEEFSNVIELLDFGLYPYNVFNKWYIDGRLYYNVIIDEKNPSEGIQEMRYIDPRHIKKIKETKSERGPNGTIIKKLANEYYIYSEGGFAAKSPHGVSATSSKIKIAKDSIIYVTSGITNSNGDMILSYLQKSLKLLSQLRALEDSIVIYRLSRAPERRIFYIDVGGLTKPKAEQYLKDTMNRFKNKLVYDSTTGEINNQKRFLTMLEDFWLPRRDGGKGTEITTLPGAQSLGQIDDILYFQKNLYKSLNVPVSRMEPETQFTLGRGSEISRDEIEFSKFITRIRGQFSQLFIKTLGTQLILKNIVTAEDWDKIKNKIRFNFNKDNFYEELKETEILRERISMLQQMDDFAGKYYSHEWIRKNVLRQSDEEIKIMDKQIKTEETIPQYQEVEADAMSTNPTGFGGSSPSAGAPPVGPDQDSGPDQ